MAEQFANRSKDLSEIYRAISASSSDGTFGRFLRSKLTKDVLRKCNATAVDLRYVTIQPDTQLYSFGDHWQREDAHVYSTRFDDPVPLPKTAEQETSCARLFVTTKPIRVLSMQRNSLLELCKKWVRGHYGTGQGSSDSATNDEEGCSAVDYSGEMLPAMPRNIFQRKDGISFLDYALYRERISDFHSVEGVAFDEAAAPPMASPSRHLLLFGAESLCLQQELVYPAKKKLRKAPDGFMSCVSEPSRPQAPPMKRGKSINTPPIASHSPAGAPPPPPPYQPKTPPHPSPRPGTPTLADEKGEGKAPAKPSAPPRETAPNKETAPSKVPASPKGISNEEAPREDDDNTQM